MKSNPQHRRQVNKQALKDETKEAARKQFSGAALSFTGRFFCSFFLFLLPTCPAGTYGPQSGLSGAKTKA